MGIQNQHWYNLNANRSYPIDETASGLSDDGAALPFNILADCILRFPTTYGLYAYVSAVSVSPHLVTLCFSASNQHPGQSALVIPDTEPSNPLLATLTVRKPITEAKHYVVTPEQPGVAGWVVFGSNLADLTYRGSFSTAAQSALLLRCGRSFVPPGVESVGKAGLAATLSGLINLHAGDDISITKEAVTLVGFGDIPNALVVRLKAATTYNVFDRYRGPCASRPESGTCRLHPLVSVGTTPFDCDGNLTLELEGVTVTPLQGGGGIVIDFGLGLDQTCARNKDLPDSVGELPNTYSDSCVVISSSIVDEPEPPTLPALVRPVLLGTCSPYYPTRWPDGSPVAPLYSILNGRFSWNPLQTRMTAEDVTQTNIAMTNTGCGNGVTADASNSGGGYPVQYTTTLRCNVTLQDGVQRNGGIVVYRQPIDPTRGDLTKFLTCTVVIDHVQDSLILALSEDRVMDLSAMTTPMHHPGQPRAPVGSYEYTHEWFPLLMSEKAYAAPRAYGPFGFKLNTAYTLTVAVISGADYWDYAINGAAVYGENGVYHTVAVTVKDVATGLYLSPAGWVLPRPDQAPQAEVNNTFYFTVPYCFTAADIGGLYTDRASALFEAVHIGTTL